jgi:autotransporter translocation and assembly factor TamB
MRRLFIAVALATLAACSNFDPLVDNTVTGTWRGSAGNQAFVLNLAQTSQIVAGNGTMTTGGVSQNLSISGTYQQPTFGGTLTPDGAQAITLTGTVDGKSMVGTLNGGGFSGIGIALLRD